MSLDQTSAEIGIAADDLVARGGASRQVRNPYFDRAQAIDAIFAKSAHAGTHLLALICIVNYTHEDGLCWSMSVSAIAERCRVSKRSASRILRDLKDSGELVVAKQGGGKVGPNFYSLSQIFLSADCGATT